jgi:hypothetical protein
MTVLQRHLTLAAATCVAASVAAGAGPGLAPPSWVVAASLAVLGALTAFWLPLHAPPVSLAHVPTNRSILESSGVRRSVAVVLFIAIAGVPLRAA